MLVFPCGSESKESACQCRTPGFDPWIRKIPWRREWLPTLVFLAGESHEQKSWAGYRSWGHKELDTTKRLSTQLPIAGIVFCFLYILLLLIRFYKVEKKARCKWNAHLLKKLNWSPDPDFTERIKKEIWA